MLGLLPNYPFAEASIELRPGDLLVIYSDGVTEAKNVLEEDFGEERLLAMVRKHSSAPLLDLLSRIVEEVTAFAGSTPQHDDITLVAMRRVK